MGVDSINLPRLSFLGGDHISWSLHCAWSSLYCFLANRAWLYLTNNRPGKAGHKELP